MSNFNEATNSYVSPLCADLSNLPEAVIIVAEDDELRPDGEKYAQRLIESGVHAFVYCQHGIGHLAGHGARVSTQAKESIDVAVQALKNAFFK